MNKNILFETMRTLVAIGVALLLAFIIIFSVSEDPGYALQRFLLGPLSSLRNFGNVLEMAIPLIFTGLAISVMFTAKQFNLGAEGGFFFGAIGATALALTFNMPPHHHAHCCHFMRRDRWWFGQCHPCTLKIKTGCK